MKKALIKALLFFLLPIPLLYVADSIITRGLQRSHGLYFAVWNDIYSSRINADVLICGSSRAGRMISPLILDSTLHSNSYNLGMDGWEFTMQYARTRIYLQHNRKPKYILQCIDLKLFTERTNLFLHEQFLPYLQDTCIVNITNRFTGRFSFAERHLPLFRYNNAPGVVAEGWWSFWGNGARQSVQKGYMPYENKWDGSFFNRVRDPEPTQADMAAIQRTTAEFDSFIHYCKANDIQLIFVYPPTFHEPHFSALVATNIIAPIRQYAEKYHLIFLDYSNDPMCYNSFYFYNISHLNKYGAELFSRRLASDLKPMISPSPRWQ